ncbi:hypothetical protein [Ekhidna sp.]|uniref:hypothetical protein n=1 Tax=Ekhidna sp. TaxID=2608089 RepID=UPI00329830BA
MRKVILLLMLIPFLSESQSHLTPLLTYGGLPEGESTQVLYNQAFVTGYSVRYETNCEL